MWFAVGMPVAQFPLWRTSPSLTTYLFPFEMLVMMTGSVGKTISCSLSDRSLVDFG